MFTLFKWAGDFSWCCYFIRWSITWTFLRRKRKESPPPSISMQPTLKWLLIILYCIYVKSCAWNTLKSCELRPNELMKMCCVWSIGVVTIGKVLWRLEMNVSTRYECRYNLNRNQIDTVRRIVWMIVKLFAHTTRFLFGFRSCHKRKLMSAFREIETLFFFWSAS